MFVHSEGATPIDDISDLKVDWVETQKDLNEVESENVFRATQMYLLKEEEIKEKWINVSFLTKLHFEMFKNIWDWAGKFRKNQTIPIGVSPYQIREEIEKLCQDIAYWENNGVELTLLERSARIHHRLVYIHPFPNGNGRFSRLVSDRYLKTWQCKYPDWPEDLNENCVNRRAYISALKEADSGFFEPLIDFKRKFGARDPDIDLFKTNSFLVDNFQDERLEMVKKAYQRCYSNQLL